MFVFPLSLFNCVRLSECSAICSISATVSVCRLVCLFSLCHCVRLSVCQAIGSVSATVSVCLLVCLLSLCHCVRLSVCQAIGSISATVSVCLFVCLLSLCHCFPLRDRGLLRSRLLDSYHPQPLTLPPPPTPVLPRLSSLLPLLLGVGSPPLNETVSCQRVCLSQRRSDVEQDWPIREHSAD